MPSGNKVSRLPALRLFSFQKQMKKDHGTASLFGDASHLGSSSSGAAKARQPRRKKHVVTNHGEQIELYLPTLFVQVVRRMQLDPATFALILCNDFAEHPPRNLTIVSRVTPTPRRGYTLTAHRGGAA